MAHSIEIIHPNYISQVWPLVEAFFNACEPHGTGEITTNQMKVMLSRGEYQLMLFNGVDKPVGALVVSFINYPNTRVMFVHAIGGKTTKEHVIEMFQWAKSHGATAVRGQARESVARLWAMKYGFETISYNVEKRL